MTETNKLTAREQLQAATKSLEDATFDVRCAHDRVMSMAPTYLIIVRKDVETQRWIVDGDSEHILDEDGGYSVLELQVDTIRALAPMPKAHIYSTNVSGKSILIKAFHMNQIAQMYNMPLSSLQPYISLCGPAVQMYDIDLTLTPEPTVEHIVEDNNARED